jgi:Tfp pilus assembly protein PilX
MKKGSVWIGILVILIIASSLGTAIVARLLTSLSAAKNQEKRTVAQALCDAGVERAIWKLNQGGAYTGETNIQMTTGILDIQVNPIDSENKEIVSSCYTPVKPGGANPKPTRKIRARISADFNGTGVAFKYGIQVGSLGITMSNNSKVVGNVYSNGPVIAGNGAEVTGDVFVSGAGNKIQNLKIGNDARAARIEESNITRDAYYITKDNKTNIGRTGYTINATGLPEQKTLPIGQQTIDQWESWALAGGIHSGNYNLASFSAASVGPKKIEGDLIVNNGATLTIKGALWVTGNVIFYNGATIKADASFGANSVNILADNPTDKVNYGKVTVNNNVNIQGSGNPKSYVMITSTNTGSTVATPAIVAGNNSTAVVYYTTTGFIEVSNNAQLRAMTGGGIHLSNGAWVIYDTGLADANFSAGPGGSWQLKEWQILY